MTVRDRRSMIPCLLGIAERACVSLLAGGAFPASNNGAQIE